VNLKTRLFAGASALVMAGTLVATAIPANAAPPPSLGTIIGGCSGQQSVAKLKVVATGLGIDNTMQNTKISLKAVVGGEGTCNLGAGPIVPDVGSFKASLTGFASCNTALLPPPGGLPPNGKFGVSFAAGLVKAQAYTRIASTDGTYNADVVGAHGMFTKGPLAGADVDGTLYQNPTIKDKTVPGGAPPAAFLGPFGAFLGVDVNGFDSGQIGASCLAGASAGIVFYNDGHGATLAIPVPDPTAITMTLVGDGPSLLEAYGLVGGLADATGLTFSIY